MIIYVLDDEPIALRGTINTIQKVVRHERVPGRRIQRYRDARHERIELRSGPEETLP